MNRKRTTSLSEQRKAEEKRYLASLHCKKYKSCMDMATDKGKPMLCHKCKSPDIEENHYRRGMGMVSVTHTDFPINLPARKDLS